jgi:carbon storage regulator
MLILTRKRGTSIRIGQDIVISVIQTGRSSVKLGIQAPAHVKIVRGELEDYPCPFDVTSSPEEALMLQH